MEKPCRKEAGRLGLRTLFLIKKALNEVKASGASPANPQLVRQQKQARWDLKVVVPEMFSIFVFLKVRD